ncbi:MFS transporter, NRE family, putaive nickel resistance protein [Methylophilus rhizosphaerae]|uniref:MFS transporter, NRE family, putaive nickel resistance protein n=1 Tax=Methylophilus rhizosphaerae TaxID=492660 RepID=A0A1G9A601_9PROT|nr:MFS transporter [Methylophilus rhizosphaerae]SDK22727.1 MFS transporter, NRE family, putaive nickel resistance protein [Methylophilus rhizosphaerae]
MANVSLKLKSILASPLTQNRNYMLLFSAQLISLVGSGLTTIGLALFAHQIVENSSAAVVIGNALMLRILAFLMFSQFAGILADRVNRKYMLIIADVVRLGLLALFPFLDSVWQIYTMIFLINAATAFFTPTFDSTLPEVAGREHYVKALSFSRVAVDLEAILAPAIAGLVFALLGLKWLFWLDSLSYLLSAVLVFATVLSYKKTIVAKFSPTSLLQELSFGTKILFREASLKRALLLSFAEALAGAAAIVATVVYIKDVLLLSETSFVLVMAGLGLGSTITALVLGKFTGRYESLASNDLELHGRRHRWTEQVLLIGGIVLGVILLPGFLKPGLAIFSFLWFLNGAGQVLIAISSTSLLAEHTAESERGRGYAAHFAWTHAFWLITYPAIGHGVAKLGVPITFTLAGIVCIFIVTFAFLYLKFTPQHKHSY